MSPHWAQWLKLAVTRYGLAPEAFWALTLAEWLALARAEPGAAPPARADLDALIARFPDHAENADGS